MWDPSRENSVEDLFETQTEHFDLKRVKDRTKRTKISYIFRYLYGECEQLADRVIKEQTWRWAKKIVYTSM